MGVSVSSANLGLNSLRMLGSVVTVCQLPICPMAKETPLKIHGIQIPAKSRKNLYCSLVLNRLGASAPVDPITLSPEIFIPQLERSQIFIPQRSQNLDYMKITIDFRYSPNAATMLMSPGCSWLTLKKAIMIPLLIVKTFTQNIFKCIHKEDAPLR